jgi:hypothetical protein
MYRGIGSANFVTRPQITLGVNGFLSKLMIQHRGPHRSNGEAYLGRQNETHRVGSWVWIPAPPQP